MKTIALVGAGALGSHFALLARNFDARLTVIDFDRIEAKNIQSQFHTKMGQGKNKAKALQQMMQGLFKRQIDAKPVKLNEGNEYAVLGEPDLIVDCTDNFRARSLIQEYVRYQGTTSCIHGCLSADGTLARCVWTEHFTPDAEGEEGEATCEDGENLPFHALASAMLAQIVQRFLVSGVKQSWQLTPFTVIRIS